MTDEMTLIFCGVGMVAYCLLGVIALCLLPGIDEESDLDLMGMLILWPVLVGFYLIQITPVHLSKLGTLIRRLRRWARRG